MGVLRRLSASRGDIETRWDDTPESIQAAKDKFEVGKADGLMAFMLDDHGVGAERITEFVPGAKEIIMTRRLIGG